MTTDKKAICEFVKKWMDSHEPDTFIKNKNGQCIYTAGATSLNITLYFEELLGDYISEHSTKEPVCWLCEKGEGRSKQTHVAWNELERAWYEDKDYTTTPLVKSKSI